MADPTAFYEPEDDELLSSLAVPSFQNAEGYEDDYRRMQELEQHAFAQHAETGEMGLEMVPEDVKRVSGRLRRVNSVGFRSFRLCAVRRTGRRGVNAGKRSDWS